MSQLKKLGVILQYTKARPDLVPLLNYLVSDWEVVLFGSQAELDQAPSHFEKRVIPPAPRNIKNRANRFLYEIFGNIPGAKENYRFWNLRRIQQEKNKMKRMKLHILLRLRLMFGNSISFDRYLNLLSLNTSANIDDIDVFFSMSDVANVNFLAQVLKSSSPLVNYIYSWDHPAKYTKFSKNLYRHLTWHDGITEDLCELHGLDRRQVETIGSTQLCLVDTYLKQRTGKTDRTSKLERYVYYGATMGYPEAIKQELNVVAYLSQSLEEVAPDVTLLFRPYPNSKALDLYRGLMDLKNVRIENTVLEGDRLTYVPDRPEEKYQKIENASIFVHMGSTIGLEAAYLDTPVIQLALDDFDYGISENSPNHLSHTLNQRHLKKYLLQSKERNVVTKKSELAPTLRDALKCADDFKQYSQYLRNLTPLQSLSEIENKITASLSQAVSSDSSDNQK